MSTLVKNEFTQLLIKISSPEQIFTFERALRKGQIITDGNGQCLQSGNIHIFSLLMEKLPVDSR